MKYPKYTDYEKMYKRYFDKGVGYLIDKADLKRDDKVLDICGGNGRLTRELFIDSQIKYTNYSQIKSSRKLA